MTDPTRSDPTKELRLDRTQEVPTETLGAQRPGKSGFRPGVAHVPEQRRDSTISFETSAPSGQILTAGQVKRPDVPLRARVQQLRMGGRWSIAGLVFLIGCWGLSVLAAGDVDKTVATLALVLTLVVAVGLFALLRWVGGMVLERMMGRPRRSAWLSHAVIGLFLIAAGFSYLRTIEWVVDAWNFLRGVR